MEKKHVVLHFFRVKESEVERERETEGKIKIGEGERKMKTKRGIRDRALQLNSCSEPSELCMVNDPFQMDPQNLRIAPLLSPHH